MLNIGGNNNFRNYGTVFQVQKEDKYVQCNLSTSEKVRDAAGNESWENSSWSARFVGEKALEKAKELSDKDRIEILSGKITSKYVKAENKTYVNLVIFDFKSPSEIEAEKAATATTDPNA